MFTLKRIFNKNCHKYPNFHINNCNQENKINFYSQKSEILNQNDLNNSNQNENLENYNIFYNFFIQNNENTLIPNHIFFNKSQDFKFRKITKNFKNQNIEYVKTHKINSTFYSFLKKNFSTYVNFNDFFYLEEIPKNIKELEIFSKKNSTNLDLMMNNPDIFDNSNESNIELFSLAIFLNKFSDNSDKKKKNIFNQLLNIFRNNNYIFLNNPKILKKENFVKLLENLHILKLNDKDKENIQNQYFSLKEKNIFDIEANKKIFNKLYFYDISGNKLQKIKRDLISEYKKNYQNLSYEDLYFINSCIIFHNSKDIVNFLQPLSLRLDNLLDLNSQGFLNRIPLDLRLFNFLPIPKIISEAKNIKNNLPILLYENNSSITSLIIPELDNLLIFENSLKKIENFLIKLSKIEYVNLEFIIPILSNSLNYLNINSEIFELFIDKLYLNLAALNNDNLIELFFFSLMITKNDSFISDKRKKIIFEIYGILSNLKTEPKIFLDTDKFFVYINNSRNNLNAANEKFVKIKNHQGKIYESFKKIIKCSLDIYPFSVKDKEYNEILLADIYLTLCRVLIK